MIYKEKSRLKALPIELQLHISHFLKSDINLFAYSVILHLIKSMHVDMSYDEIFQNFELFKHIILYFDGINYKFSSLTVHYLNLYLQNLHMLYQKNYYKFHFCLMLKEFGFLLYTFSSEGSLATLRH